MALQIGDIAPDFEANTTEGRLKFHDYIEGSWVVFFSHPKDFTPVCTTELGSVAKMKHDFEKRGVKLIGISIDSVEGQCWRPEGVSRLERLKVVGARPALRARRYTGRAMTDNPQMAQSWENHYQMLVKSAQVEEARKKFTSQGWSSKQPSDIVTPPRT